MPEKPKNPVSVALGRLAGKMTRQRTSAPYGETIRYVAYNDDTGKWDQVYSESEIPDTQLVIPMYWVESISRYVTVPGTEFYGPVPAEAR